MLRLKTCQLSHVNQQRQSTKMGVLVGKDAITDHPHNYVNPPSNAWESTTADLIGLCLTFIVIIVRYYTKIHITKSTGWEDRESSPQSPFPVESLSLTRWIQTSAC